MSIYATAYQASKAGHPQYIVSKSLDTVLVSSKATLYRFLKDGYTLDATYVDGIRESSWLVSNEAALETISEVCDLKAIAEAPLIRVKTRDYLRHDGVSVDQTVLTLRLGEQRGSCYVITAKDYFFPPETASRILDTLRIFRIKTDSKSMLADLERSMKTLANLERDLKGGESIENS